MYGDIEELVLSGKLFNPPSRSSSPVRTPSPLPWPTDGEDYGYSDAPLLPAQAQQESIGMGPGRTGVKGVIRDRAEAAGLARARRAQEIDRLNKAMEKTSLGGKTWAEEERERQARGEKTELSEKSREPERRGWFGHLREVGVRGYVQAVENEERSVSVVLHIYDPSLDRCATIDETLTRLARQYPATKFLRARAGAIGFASSSSSASTRAAAPRAPFHVSRRMLLPGQYADEDDDPFDDAENDDGDSERDADEGWEDDMVDTDVLPTMLVYRGGELVHSWVRVDWEATAGLEDLLRRHHILADHGILSGGASDDEDDDDGELVFSGSDEY